MQVKLVEGVGTLWTEQGTVGRGKEGRVRVEGGRACASPESEGAGIRETVHVQGGREQSHGKTSVAAHGPTHPSSWQNQAAKHWPGWAEPWQWPLPVSFPDRCSSSPACTCGLSATHTLAWHLCWQ